MNGAVSNRQLPVRIRLLPGPIDRVLELGAIPLSCRVTLWLEISTALPAVPMNFLLDSGASYSVINLATAIQQGLPVPPAQAETELQLRTATGLDRIRVRPGRIRAWWDVGHRGHPFDWPVLFRVNGPAGVPPVLGMGGIVKTCRWVIDGASTRTYPYGYVELQDTR